MAETGSGPSVRAKVGSFELDLRSGELRALEPGASNGMVVLREQPFRILRMLLERGGKLVTRDEIRKALWPNDTIVDFDHSINAAMVMLRRALGDSAANPRYIETIGRRGYRLLPVVEKPRPRSTGPDAPVPAGGPATPIRTLGDLLGKKVSHYRVLEVLGGGGMGMVYKAEDLKLGRRVALKFLPEELANDSIALLRIEREAQMASALNHSNICTVFEIGEHAGHPFIAMEFRDGETLQHRITASAPAPLPTALAVDIAIQVCSGLEAAHEKDIVHRDIKPANIFLPTEGPVKLLDFGVAKVLANDAGIEVEHAAPDGPIPVAKPGLTRTGAGVGTTGYMSPEQIQRLPLDARSDLFSLGLVLYEMTTGRRAHPGDVPGAVAEAIGSATPSRARAENPAIPSDLDAVIARALEHAPERRYQTAADMRRDLEQVRDRMARSRRLHPRFLLVGVPLLVLMVSGTAVWLLRARPVATLAPDDTVMLAPLTNETGDRVYDDALFVALRFALEQTPYLNVLADYRVFAATKAMNLKEGTKTTPEIALEICRRTGSRIIVAPSIANAGNRFTLGVGAVDCQSGATIARVIRDAVSRDTVIRDFGVATAQLRRLLGEPAESISEFNAPLDQAVSASPEAIELLTLGYRRQLAGRSLDAIPYYQRATEADPRFALAYAALSMAYGNEGQPSLATGSAMQAFELRAGLTRPARYMVESAYLVEVTGEIKQVCSLMAEWVHAFPHHVVARNNLSQCLAELGEPEGALGEAREAVRLLPSSLTYRVLVQRSLSAERLEEGRSAYEEALRQGFDSPWLRNWAVLIAFLQGDDDGMRKQWSWAHGKPDAESILLLGRAMVEAYHGQLGASLQSATTADARSAKVGDGFRAELATALMRAEAGVRGHTASVGMPTAQLKERVRLALILARTGRLEEAQMAADALRRDFPKHTLVQKYALPVIEAAMKLESRDAPGAVEALRPVAAYELSEWEPIPNLYSAYLRGLALLRMSDGRAAAAEFRKLLARPGLVGRWAIGAMARVQLGRALHLNGDDAEARSSYEEFLRLWKDADDDLPLYKEAKAEYRRLQTR